MNKSIFLIFLALSSFLFAQENQKFIFKQSKVYNVFNFMQTASSMQGTSSTFRKDINAKFSSNQDFTNLINDFKKIDFNNSFTREDYPASRVYRKDYLDLIVPHAVNSKSVKEFNERITGILPIQEQKALVNTLVKAEPFYDKIVDKNEFKKAENQIKILKKNGKICSELFEKFNRFYKSSWATEIPFIVNMYPIPGNSGTTSATPHGNILSVGTLTDTADISGTLGVSLHEMCHILYSEQSKEVQFEIEKYFSENKSPYSKLAYSYFNEAIATALGNGYAYKILNNGRLDKNDWYNNAIINGFAKSIYPLTESYLNQNKSIDKNFIDAVVSNFAVTFPLSVYEYTPNFNTVDILTDKLNGNLIFDSFFQYFEANNLRVSNPLKNVSESPTIKDSNSTLLFIVDDNWQENFNEIKLAFTILKNTSYSEKIENISFIDKSGRMIVILFLHKKEDLNSAFEKLSKTKSFDKNKLIQY